MAGLLRRAARRGLGDILEKHVSERLVFKVFFFTDVFAMAGVFFTSDFSF